MKNFFRFVAIILVMCFFASCTSMVRFSANVDDAQVYVDDELVGTTPVRMSISNAVWENPDVVIKKEGYKDLYTELKKEVKVGNLICGIICVWPLLLWCYGPKKNQNFMLEVANPQPSTSEKD